MTNREGFPIDDEVITSATAKVMEPLDDEEFQFILEMSDDPYFLVMNDGGAMVSRTIVNFLGEELPRIVDERCCAVVNHGIQMYFTQAFEYTDYPDPDHNSNVHICRKLHLAVELPTEILDVEVRIGEEGIKFFETGDDPKEILDEMVLVPLRVAWNYFGPQFIQLNELSEMDQSLITRMKETLNR